MSKPEIKVVSEAGIRRMPGYLRFLYGLRQSGREAVSCTRIAAAFKVSAIQVRKDLSSAGITGRPKTGYNVGELIDQIEHFLGWHNTREAVLAGVGHLGRALLGYEGFRANGLEIVCAFDVDRELIGTRQQGCEVMPVEKMKDLVARMHIQLGIIATPAEAAQQTADQMVAGGIRAIWTFAPLALRVPEGVMVEPVELAASLAVLSHRLEQLES